MSLDKCWGLNCVETVKTLDVILHELEGLSSGVIRSHLYFKRTTHSPIFSFFFLKRAYDKGVGFPGSSGGKEYACNAGDPSSIPGLGSSLGEGIGYPHQYSWASLVAQMT